MTHPVIRLFNHKIDTSVLNSRLFQTVVVLLIRIQIAPKK